MTDDRDEFPADDEIPDDVPSVDDIDPFTVDDNNFDNVDEFAVAEWVATSADHRVIEAVRHLDGNDDDGQNFDVAAWAKIAEGDDAQEFID